MTDTARLPLSEISVDAERFQFKAAGGRGVTEEMQDVRRWEPDAEGVLSVWRDPADRRTYVVNGHHRLELAHRTRQADLRCRYLDAPDAKTARLRGALINIREGRGTALDAAKVFRDAGLTPEDLTEMGISTVRGTLARDGLALANLHPSLFYRVVTGRMGFYRAVTIGRELPDHAQQLGLVGLLDQYEKNGKKAVSDLGVGKGGELQELIRHVREAGEASFEQQDLFGAHQMKQSLAIPRAKVSSYVRERLGTEQRTFRFVSATDRATMLEDAGNTILVQQNERRSLIAAQMLELYEKLCNKQGAVSSVLSECARRLAAGDVADTVKRDAYQAIMQELLAMLGAAVDSDAA